MHYIPVKRDIKTGISSLYLLLCDFFFLLFLLLYKPSANKKSGISSLYLLLWASFFCFSFSFAMRPSFTVVIRQCSANCSCQALNCIWRQWWSNRRATEQMELGEGQQGRMNKYSDPRPFHTRFANWHIWLADTTKLCTDTARWRTYTVDSVRQRDIPWHSVSKRDMSSNGVQKPYMAYRDRRQRDWAWLRAASSYGSTTQTVPRCTRTMSWREAPHGWFRSV